jgi:hypothetical protein
MQMQRKVCLKTISQGSIFWKIPPGGGGYRPMSLGGKNMKRRREERGKKKKERGKKHRKGEVNG